MEYFFLLLLERLKTEFFSVARSEFALGRPGDGGGGPDGIDRRGNVGKRHEEGGDLDRLWRTRRQTTQGRRR